MEVGARVGRADGGRSAYLIAGEIEDLDVGGFLRQLGQVVQPVQLVATQVQGQELQGPRWASGVLREDTGQGSHPPPALSHLGDDVLLNDAQHSLHAAAPVQHHVDVLRHQV